MWDILLRPKQRRRSKGFEHKNSNLSFLPDLHSLYLFKGQPIPGSIINPGGRRTGMAGNPLSDLATAAFSVALSSGVLGSFDGAARIHVFGDARRTETVTADSFQDGGNYWLA
jgi:hypothetical protein